MKSFSASFSFRRPLPVIIFTPSPTVLLYQSLPRFNAQSLVGRLVSQANTVLDNYYLDSVQYRLALQDIQVS
jgi:hypothetical protein